MIGSNPPTITMPSGSYTTQRDTTFIELSHHDDIAVHARSRQTELISILERLGMKGR